MPVPGRQHSSAWHMVQIAASPAGREKRVVERVGEIAQITTHTQGQTTTELHYRL